MVEALRKVDTPINVLPSIYVFNSIGSASTSQSRENPSGSVSTPDKSDAPVVTPTNEGLEQFRKELGPSGAIAGIFSLSTHEGESLDEEFYSSEDRAPYFREYPFLKEIPAGRYARTDGWQVFCAVPSDPKASVAVKADEIFLYINGIAVNDGESFGHDMVEYDY